MNDGLVSSMMSNASQLSAAFIGLPHHLTGDAAVHGQPRFRSSHTSVAVDRGRPLRGVDSAGQSRRIASDARATFDRVCTADARYLAVTSYTASGILRWRRTIEPALGTFVGDWVVPAPNGDFIAIGHNQDSHGRPIQKHDGPVRHRRDAALASGLFLGFLSGGWTTRSRLCGQRLSHLELGRERLVRAEGPALPVLCSGRRGARTAASMPSLPRWC